MFLSFHTSEGVIEVTDQLDSNWTFDLCGWITSGKRCNKQNSYSLILVCVSVRLYYGCKEEPGLSCLLAVMYHLAQLPLPGPHLLCSYVGGVVSDSHILLSLIALPPGYKKKSDRCDVPTDTHTQTGTVTT